MGRSAIGNKEALLRGALGCLMDKGYSGTTARDLASRAGTSLAAIGYHFGGTQQLLNEAIAEAFRLWRSRLAGVLEAHARLPIAELIPVVGGELASLFEEHRPLFKVFFEALATVDQNPEVLSHAAALYEEERAGIAALLRLAVGDEMPDEPAAAALIQAVVDGLIVQSLIAGRAAPDPRRVLGVLTPIVAGAAD